MCDSLDMLLTDPFCCAIFNFLAYFVLHLHSKFTAPFLVIHTL